MFLLVPAYPGCPGSKAVKWSLCISVVFVLLRFDFSGRTPLPLCQHAESTVEAVADGRCDAVFMWWELEMEDNTQLTLSTAPYWAHPTPDCIQVSSKH